MACVRASVARQNFVRVQNAARVHRLLQRLHQLQSGRRLVEVEQVPLLEADAVLCADTTAVFSSPFEEVGLDGGLQLGVEFRRRHVQVDVAIACGRNMAPGGQLSGGATGRGFESQPRRGFTELIGVIDTK